MKSRNNYSYIIFLLLLIIILSSGISFSRYISTLVNNGDASTVIVVDKYNLSVQWSDQLNGLQYPGITNQSYDFNLENTETTDLSYTITIAMDWNEATPVIGLNVPLNMELYTVNPDSTLTPVTTTSSGGLSLNSIQTQEAVIAGNQSIHFRILWNWGTSTADRDYRFANKIIDVKIDVNAEQYVNAEP